MGFPVGVYSNETTAQTITSFSILELDFLAKHEGMQKGHHHREAMWPLVSTSSTSGSCNSKRLARATYQVIKVSQALCLLFHRKYNSVLGMIW